MLYENICNHTEKCCVVSRRMMSLLAAALLVARLAAAEPHSELAEGDNPCVDKEISYI